LFQTVHDPRERSEENPEGWLLEYIDNATEEKKWRHKMWKWALRCLVLAIIIFFVTVIMIILIN